MLAESLARTPYLRSLAPPEAQLVAGLRLWIMMGKMGRCPLRAVGDRLGSARAAAHLHLLLEEIGAAWPDPFCAAPPCCPRLSHDETLAVEMVRVAGRGDRPGFDRLLADLLPGHVRERLFLSASVLEGALNV
jgi:hypothetical protein